MSNVCCGTANTWLQPLRDKILHNILKFPLILLRSPCDFILLKSSSDFMSMNPSLVSEGRDPNKLHSEADDLFCPSCAKMCFSVITMVIKKNGCSVIKCLSLR